jgi:SAM-dependent methyltransferase
MTSRQKWEERYAASTAAAGPPAALLAAAVAAIPAGRALDIACGDGRNALFLARRGFRVDAVDYAYAGLSRLAVAARREGVAVQPIVADLENYVLPEARYAVVVNTRYLQLSLFESIRNAVEPGGLVIFETFLRREESGGHPRNPAFLLESGELARRFDGFEVVSYQEGPVDDSTQPLARIVARRRRAID